MKEKILVVSAHAGDFLWRSGGAIAKYVNEGAEVHLIVLTYGLRGEANDLWTQENMTNEKAKAIRLAETTQASKILGINQIDFWDYSDYPFEIDLDKQNRLAIKIREIRPDFIITHDKESDAYNPDHGIVANYVWRSSIFASAAGMKIVGLPVGQRYVPIFGFEPHYSEVSKFKPDVYIDITDTFAIKAKAMSSFKSQSFMAEQYTRKAENRAKDVAGRTGNKECLYAEAFSMYFPVYKINRFVY
jgi:4-oxalomesaconate hydratase